MKNKKTQKKSIKGIDWLRVTTEAISDGLEKSIELIVLALVVGISLKVILVTVPSIVLGAAIVQAAKLKMLNIQ